MSDNEHDQERTDARGCAGYLGHLFTKSEIYASTTSLVSYIVFKKMYLLGEVRAGEFTFDTYAFVYFDSAERWPALFVRLRKMEQGTHTSLSP